MKITEDAKEIHLLESKNHIIIFVSMLSVTNPKASVQ